MRIEILRLTIVDLNAVQVGDVVDTSERTAHLLIQMGKAKEAPVSQTVVITPEVEKAPAPKPKRKKADGNFKPGI